MARDRNTRNVIEFKPVTSEAYRNARLQAAGAVNISAILEHFFGMERGGKKRITASDLDVALCSCRQGRFGPVIDVVFAESDEAKRQLTASGTLRIPGPFNPNPDLIFDAVLIRRVEVELEKVEGREARTGVENTQVLVYPIDMLAALVGKKVTNMAGSLTKFPQGTWGASIRDGDTIHRNPDAFGHEIHVGGIAIASFTERDGSWTGFPMGADGKEIRVKRIRSKGAPIPGYGAGTPVRIRIQENLNDYQVLGPANDGGSVDVAARIKELEAKATKPEAKAEGDAVVVEGPELLSFKGFGFDPRAIVGIPGGGAKVHPNLLDELRNDMSSLLAHPGRRFYGDHRWRAARAIVHGAGLAPAQVARIMNVEAFKALFEAAVGVCRDAWTDEKAEDTSRAAKEAAAAAAESKKDEKGKANGLDVAVLKEGIESGMSYKKVAELLGISTQKAVAACKRHGIERPSAQA